MKKFLFLTLFLLTLFTSKAESYNTFSLSYENIQLWTGGKSLKTETDYLNGFGLQYNHGIGLGEKPMNIEVGLKLNFDFNYDSYKIITAKYKDTFFFMQMNIPISYIYNFTLSEKCRLAPYAGLDFNVNLIANNTLTDPNDVSVTNSLFKKQAYEGEEFSWINNKWKRFQMGWHIGLRFIYEKYYLGLEYGTEFMPIGSNTFKLNDEVYKYNTKTGNLSINLGYYF